MLRSNPVTVGGLVLATVNAPPVRPVPARGGVPAGAAQAAPGMAGVILEAPPVVVDGQGGLVSLELWGQLQGTLCVMCQSAFPLV